MTIYVVKDIKCEKNDEPCTIVLICGTTLLLLGHVSAAYMLPTHSGVLGNLMVHRPPCINGAILFQVGY
ncbi:hypothetical protein J6590_073757 [Homalodisca vitripennis]|nr:hypothetical protein J6590_073757 [Homalodisca vitripennis]